MASSSAAPNLTLSKLPNEVLAYILTFATEKEGEICRCTDPAFNNLIDWQKKSHEMCVNIEPNPDFSSSEWFLLYRELKTRFLKEKDPSEYRITLNHTDHRAIRYAINEDCVHLFRMLTSPGNSNAYTIEACIDRDGLSQAIDRKSNKIIDCIFSSADASQDNQDLVESVLSKNFSNLRVVHVFFAHPNILRFLEVEDNKELVMKRYFYWMQELTFMRQISLLVGWIIRLVAGTTPRSGVAVTCVAFLLLSIIINVMYGVWNGFKFMWWLMKWLPKCAGEIALHILPLLPEVTVDLGWVVCRISALTCTACIAAMFELAAVGLRASAKIVSRIVLVIFLIFVVSMLVAIQFCLILFVPFSFIFFLALFPVFWMICVVYMAIYGLLSLV